MYVRIIHTHTQKREALPLRSHMTTNICLHYMYVRIVITYIYMYIRVYYMYTLILYVHTLVSHI